jgi:hypothetical protein
VPLLKGNLHAHSTFSDGHYAVEDVIARYRELGYDFLAITDHDDRVTEDYWLRIPLGDAGLIVLPGIELDYRPLSQHVGKVTGDRETLFILNHPARYGLGVREILARVAAIRSAGWPIEAVEVTDAGVYRPEHDVPAIALAPHRHRRFPLGVAVRARVGRGGGRPAPRRHPPRGQGGRLPAGLRPRRGVLVIRLPAEVPS